MKQVDWDEFGGKVETLPIGLFYAAGHYIDDPEYTFVTMMYSDVDYKVYCVDIEFAEVTKPEDVLITHVAEVRMATHPAFLVEEIDHTTIMDVVSEASEFLTSYKSENGADRTKCLALLETLVDLIEEESYAYGT